MQPVGVHHVSINVNDVAEGIAFYTDVLGLSIRTDRPDADIGVGGAWLDAGGQQVHLLECGPPPGLGQHFALHVADLDAVIVELRGRDIDVSDASKIGTGLQAFVSDPWGNLVELHQTA